MSETLPIDLTTPIKIKKEIQKALSEKKINHELIKKITTYKVMDPDKLVNLSSTLSTGLSEILKPSSE